MIRRLYDWTMGLAGGRHAERALFAVSFAESSFFPIPPDALMIPMILARREAAFRIALIATIASVLGALLGYYIGAALMDSVGQWVLTTYGKQDDFESLAARFSEWGAWAVLFAGVTPFPFKVITIFSGAVKLSLPVFIASAVVARSLRFFIVAALLWRFGEPIRDFIERRLGLVFTLFMVALIGGFVALKLL